SCPQVDASRFWAVLIGIDSYPSSPLRGCVNDANKIAQYLMEDLGVTEDHIQRSEPKNTNIDCMAPTRANIIASLLRHSTDSRIKEGDNILIHFSGHGSKYFCSDYPPYKATSAGTGSIEVLCPIDRDVGHGGTVPDISDREINVILSEISRTKGHRITFILDCCHSSGLTR
ncbi:hypothetical protein ARMGADRAFT_901484, partial [Armillaria gallica]